MITSSDRPFSPPTMQLSTGNSLRWMRKDADGAPLARTGPCKKVRQSADTACAVSLFNQKLFFDAPAATDLLPTTGPTTRPVGVRAMFGLRVSIFRA